MTRKDFVALAEAIRRAKPENELPEVRQGRVNVAESIADALYNDNMRFDRERFLKACGL